MTEYDDVRSEEKVKEVQDAGGDGSSGEAQQAGGFQEILDSTIKDLKEGEIVQGEIIQITPEHVIVDVGYKSEGRIPIAQFKDREGTVTVKVGDSVQVYLDQWEDDDGEIVLSKDKADQLRVWEEINKVIEKDGVIEGKINALIKGGLAVDIGVQAFLPGHRCQPPAPP